VIQAQRTTGDGKYTDLFTLTFESIGLGSVGLGMGLNPNCQMTACSESQVFSILDFSTNYCTLRNLYCNSAEGCAPVQYELDYKEDYTSCGQHAVENCIVESIKNESL